MMPLLCLTYLNINYLVVDKKMGYEEIDKMNFKKKNK